MTTIASSTAYSLIRPKTWWQEIPVLLSFNLLLVACAYISISLPFSPVPITGQTFAVLVVAMALGRVRGTAVVAAYLVEGLVGWPVFAEGRAGLAVFLGPTGGYLLGFLAAAALVGWLADRGWDKRLSYSVAAMVLGTGVIFVAGLSWLRQFVPGELLMTSGLTPFLPGAVVKIALASLILPSLWRLVRR